MAEEWVRLEFDSRSAPLSFYSLNVFSWLIAFSVNSCFHKYCILVYFWSLKISGCALDMGGIRFIRFLVSYCGLICGGPDRTYPRKGMSPYLKVTELGYFRKLTPRF